MPSADDALSVQYFMASGMPFLKMLLRTDKAQLIGDPIARFQENMLRFCRIRLDIKVDTVDIYLEDRLVCTELL
jgi:hypothetical protein